MFVNEETEFDGDDDFDKDNGGRSFFMETLKSSSHIQLAGPSISSSVPVIDPPDEHSKSFTDGDTEGENSCSFLIHCISSHPSFRSDQKPNGDAKFFLESETPSLLLETTAISFRIYLVQTILGFFISPSSLSLSLSWWLGWLLSSN